MKNRDGSEKVQKDQIPFLSRRKRKRLNCPVFSRKWGQVRKLLPPKDVVEKERRTRWKWNKNLYSCSVTSVLFFRFKINFLQWSPNSAIFLSLQISTSVLSFFTSIEFHLFKFVVKVNSSFNQITSTCCVTQVSFLQISLFLSFLLSLC